MKVPFNVLTAAALALGTASFAAPADAAPITAPSSLQTAAAPPVETVAWRRDWGGRAWGWAPGAAGAIAGGALATARGYYDAYAYYPSYGYSYPGYGYGYGYDYAPGYSGYAYSPGYTTGYSGDGDDAYCSQRFRSYDRASGTYMGYDGRRHSCP
jgi:hypothetical protein